MNMMHVVNRSSVGDFMIRRGYSIFTNRNNDKCRLYDVTIFGPSVNGGGTVYNGNRYQIYKILTEESGEIIRDYHPVPDAVMAEAYQLCNQRHVVNF